MDSHSNDLQQSLFASENEKKEQRTRNFRGAVYARLLSRVCVDNYHFLIDFLC